MAAAVAPDSAPRPKAPRAGRPTAARAAQIDDQIRAAARRLFLDLGFEGTSMDLVAREARVSKGTLYARFAGKDTLLLAVIDDLLRQLDARASANDHSLPDELSARLTEYARRFVQVMDWDEYRQLLLLTQSAARIQPELCWSWQGPAMAGNIASLARLMQSSVPSVHAEAAYWHHLASLLIHGVGSWYRSERSAGPVNPAHCEEYCSEVIAAITASIRSRSDEVARSQSHR